MILLRLAGGLPVEERSAIAAYPRSGAIVTAPMEYTSDVIGEFPKVRRENLRLGAKILDIDGGRFAVSGGSGISTDGVYGWRQDTADYVEHYGVGARSALTGFSGGGGSIGRTPEYATKAPRVDRPYSRVRHKSPEGRSAVLGSTPYQPGGSIRRTSTSSNRPGGSIGHTPDG